MFLVNPVMGALTLIGVYFIARLWLPRPYCVVASLALALNGMFEFFSGYLLSHAAELCFITWGLCFLLWFLKTSELPPDFGTPRTVANRPWRAALLALLSGQAFGYACAVRYTSAAMALPIAWAALVFLWRYRKATIGSRIPAYVLLASFAVIPTLCAVYNHFIFGAFYQTGYALTDEQNSYTWEHFLRGSHILLSGMNSDVAFMLFPLAAIAIFALVSAAHRILFVLVILPLYLVYASYYWTPNGNHYFRFMLFSVSVLVPLGLVTIGRLEGSPSVRRWAVFGLLLLVASDAYSKMIEPGIEGRWFANMQSAAEMNLLLESTVSPDAVVFTSSADAVHEGPVNRLKVYALSAFDPGSRPPPMRDDPLGQPIRFAWTKAFYKVSRSDVLIARKQAMIRGYIAQHREVIMVLDKPRLAIEQKQLGKDFKLRLLKEVTLSHWGQPIPAGVYMVVPVPPPVSATMPLEK